MFVIGIPMLLINWPMPKLETLHRNEWILIKGANIVDVINGSISTRNDIYIHRNRIVHIDSIAIDRNIVPDLVINAQNKYIIPGLWDMHTHSSQYSPWVHHPLFLANGVTSIRDMSGQMSEMDSYWAGSKERIAWNKSLLEKGLPSPRHVLQSSFQINGPSSVPSGFPEYFKMESMDDVDQLLQFYKGVQTDFIKVYSMMSPDIYRELAKKVKNHDMHIAGHKVLSVSLEEAIILGQRSFEHGRIFMYDCFPDAKQLRMAENKFETYKELKNNMINDFNEVQAAHLMRLMAKHDSYWVPTLQTLKSAAFSDDQDFLDSPLLKYIPKTRKGIWWNPDVSNNSKYNLSEEGKGVNMGLYLASKEQIKMANDLNVKIMAGTDNTDTYTFAGFSLHDELKELASSGLSNMEAIRSATIIPAEYADRAHDLGSVEIGKLADLVILNDNPLEDIRNTQKIHSVFIDGLLLDRTKIENLKERTSSLTSTLHFNFKFVYSMLASPLMRVQLMD